MTARPGRPSRRWILVGLIVLLMLITVGVVGWTQDDGEEGAIAELEFTPDYGRSLEFQLPRAPITVSVGYPTGEIRAEGDDAEETTGAGRGLKFLPIWWSHGMRDHRAAPVEDASDWSDRAGVEIAVVADGEHHVVLEGESNANVLDPRKFAVGVPDDIGLDDVTVEVTFDGLTQVGDLDTGEIDAGAAQILYEPTRELSPGAGCWPDGVRRPVRVPTRCEVEPIRFRPWDPERGWVEEPGRAWAYVTVSVSVAHDVVLGSPETFYRVAAAGEVEVRLDGAEPLGEAASDYSAHVAHYTKATHVFESSVEPKELVVSGQWGLEPAGGPGGKRTYRFSERMELS